MISAAFYNIWVISRRSVLFVPVLKLSTCQIITSSTPYHEQESFIIYSCVTGQHKLVYTVETLCIKVEWTNDIISNYPSTEFELSRLYYTNKFHKQP